MHYGRWLKTGSLAAPPLAQPAAQRFWNSVDKGDGAGCWSWTAGTDDRGYGRITCELGRCVPASRYSWYLHQGPIPADAFVCHHCDNPTCIRPDHLFLGTHADNMADMDAKGRRRSGTRSQNGSQNFSAKLTENDVADMRHRYTGATGQQAALAREYGISRSTVSEILLGRRWRHVL